MLPLGRHPRHEGAEGDQPRPQQDDADLRRAGEERNAEDHQPGKPRQQLNSQVAIRALLEAHLARLLLKSANSIPHRGQRPPASRAQSDEQHD